MSDLLPTHIRPITFAGTELVLDMVQAVKSHYQTDLEGMLILMCAQYATMRTFVLDPSTPPEVLHAPRPSDEVRGAISRRMLAEHTGLPRETVRRKTAELAERGFLTVDDEDRVRVPPRLNEPEVQKVVEAAHGAILRYLDRLEAFGVDWKSLPKEKP